MTRARAALLALTLALPSACAATPSGATPPPPTIWHVKAIHPDGSFLNVKAVTADGRILDVKALEVPGNLHLMRVVALRDGAELPVEIAADETGSLRAVAADGATIPVRALLPDGAQLDVRGVERDGNLVHVKAVEPGGGVLGVKAISAEGHLMDVKGVAFGATNDAAGMPRPPIAVRAIPQVIVPFAAERTWHLRAIHPQGRALRVMARDADGALLDVAAFEVPSNAHVMDVKARRGGQRLSVKVLAEPGEPVRAITPEGEVLAVVAVEAGGEPLPIRAVRRSGDLLHVKAIGPGGVHYGVKALSPEGFLHDVKGVAVSDRLEGEEHGVSFSAHVKALPQVLGSEH